MRTPLSIWRDRTAIPRAIRRYENHLRALRTETIPNSRSGHLDVMAMIAENISGYEHRDEESGAWSLTSHLLRAIAATERFCVLTDIWEYGEDEPQRITGPAYSGQWEALAAAAVTGDRRERAAILHDLCSEAVTAPGILVLDDIADTELAIADGAVRASASGYGKNRTMRRHLLDFLRDHPDTEISVIDGKDADSPAGPS